MKIVIIRHADPDYSIDSLTEKGWREAALLNPYVQGLKPDYAYVSPLGRAQDTAKTALKGVSLRHEPQTEAWLREFMATCKRPHTQNHAICWDWLPADWTADPRYLNADTWLEPEVMHEEAKGRYEEVVQGLDALLAQHGYVRHVATPQNPGRYYDAVSPNHDTIVLFCHFGVECVLLSRLINISPMLLWHGTVAAPTGVTVLVTEERRDKQAYFRMQQFGSTAHLYQAGEEPSYAARFREVFSDDEFPTALFD